MRNFLIYSLISTGLILSCNPQEKQPVESIPALDGQLIYISEEQAKTIGLDFKPLRYLELPDIVTANGYLETPPQYQAKVSSNIQGRIVKVMPLIGDYVKKGQIIIQIESIEFLEMQKNYIVLKSTLKFLEDDYLRQKKLSEQNVNAKKVFLQAEKDYMAAKAEYEIMHKKFEILQVNIEDIEKGKVSTYHNIRSPINGYVNRINTVLGDFIDTDDMLIEILNPEHLHAELNVYERDILKIEIGQEVIIRVLQIEELEIRGEVFLIDKELDEVTRTATIHVHILENKNLLTGMYIEGQVQLDHKKALVVPAEGLVREEGSAFVYFLMDKVNDGYSLKKELVHIEVERQGLAAIRFIEEVDTTKMLAVGGVNYLSNEME